MTTGERKAKAIVELSVYLLVSVIMWIIHRYKNQQYSFFSATNMEMLYKAKSMVLFP